MNLNLDKSTWQTVRFGDVAKNMNENVHDPASEGIDRIIALEHLDGGELEIARWGSTEDSTTFTRRVRPGQTLFGKRRAYQRKIAYAEFDAITSGDILTFDANSDLLLPELLPFLVQSEPFFAHALGTSAGSLSPRTNWGDLSKFEFSLPSLDEQRRLADLLWSAEHHRRTLVALRQSLATSLDEYAASLFRKVDETKPLGEIATPRSGPSFAASDVSDSPIPGALPVLGITNTKPDGTVDMTGVGYVSALPASVGTIDEGSLVLIRTNGNRGRIGNVYIPPIAAYGHAVSAFQFLLSPKNADDRDYLYWVLTQPSMQAAMSDSASGSTGLGNLAAGWLKAQAIPWPTEHERALIVLALDAAADAVGSVKREIDAVQQLSSAILQEVFG